MFRWIIFILIVVLCITLAWGALFGNPFFHLSANTQATTAVEPVLDSDKSDAAKSDSPLNGASVNKATDQLYKNEEYGFSFRYPKDFTVGIALQQDEGTLFIIQDPKTNRGVQLSITSFEGEPDEDVMRELIQRDLPDLMVAEGLSVTIANGIQGFLFTSDNPAFGGSSREFWFLHRGHLYQFTTSISEGKLLRQIFGTMTFTA